MMNTFVGHREQVIRRRACSTPSSRWRSTKDTVENLISEIRKCVETGERVLVTTIDEAVSEDLTSYLREAKMPRRYLHSDIDRSSRWKFYGISGSATSTCSSGLTFCARGLDHSRGALVAGFSTPTKEGFSAQ